MASFWSLNNDSIQVKYIATIGNSSSIVTGLSEIWFLSGTCYTSTAIQSFKVGGFIANRIDRVSLRGTCFGSADDSSTMGSSKMEINTMLIDIDGGNFIINTSPKSPIYMFGSSSVTSYYTVIGK